MFRSRYRTRSAYGLVRPARIDLFLRSDLSFDAHSLAGLFFEGADEADDVAEGCQYTSSAAEAFRASSADEALHT